jgi:hypothetical protein
VQWHKPQQLSHLEHLTVHSAPGGKLFQDGNSTKFPVKSLFVSRLENRRACITALGSPTPRIKAGKIFKTKEKAQCQRNHHSN